MASNKRLQCTIENCHSGSACKVKAHLFSLLAKNLARKTILSGLNLVVVAVLRDSLYVVSLMPCVADCCMLYTICKVERFVLTVIKRRLLLLSKLLKFVRSSSQ